MTTQEERLLLKNEQKCLQKQFEFLSERIAAQKARLRGMDPKWNAKCLIDYETDVLIDLRAKRAELLTAAKANADRIKALGRAIAEENKKRHDRNVEHKEIRRFNRAFTARIHRYEREEALKKVEAHNRALLGEEE